MGFNGLYTVTGVFQKPPATALDKFDVIFNFDLYLQKNPKLTTWGNNDPDTYLILKKGTDIGAFNNKIAGFIIGKKSKESKSALFVQKFGDKYLYNHYKNGIVAGGRIEYVKLFSGNSPFYFGDGLHQLHEPVDSKSVNAVKGSGY